LALVENPAGRVRVGKVDCSRFIGIICPLPHFFLFTHTDTVLSFSNPEFCADNDISSYPTITFFKNGKEKKPRLSGERTLASLRTYIDKFVPRSKGKFDEDDIL